MATQERKQLETEKPGLWNPTSAAYEHLPLADGNAQYSYFEKGLSETVAEGMPTGCSKQSGRKDCGCVFFADGHVETLTENSDPAKPGLPKER